jgi:hypothetical protein
MHNVTVSCFTIICTKQFRRTWETLKEDIILQGNAHSHAENLKVTPSLQAWISPQWFSFVWTNQGAPWRTEISKWWTQTWCPELLYSQDKTFYAASINNFPGWQKMCVGIKGEYIEKEWQFGDSGMYMYIIFVKKNKVQVNHEPTPQSV